MHGGPFPPPHPRAAEQRRYREPRFVLFQRVSITIFLIILVGLCASFAFGDLSTRSAASPLKAFAAELTDTDVSASLPASGEVAVTWQSQLPSLPTGCEITSAAILLSHYGYAVTNTALNEYLVQSGTIDTYTVLGKRYGPDPDECFIGSTESTDGCNCNPGPIIEAINAYLADSGISSTAVDLTGSSPSELYQMVAEGTPVEVWVTIDMEARQSSDSWYSEVDGELVQIDNNDHSMVLIGYDKDTVTLADPLEGIVTYPRSTFESVYRARGEMAVAIQS